MGRLVRGWFRVLVGLMPVGLLLVACSGATGASNTAGVAAPRGEPTAVVSLDKFRATPSDGPVLYVNVDMTDDGIQPPSIFIPVGRRVQLVMRNRGVTEHHYKVLGLVPRDLLWIATEEADLMTDAEDHAHHHGASLGEERATSAAGIRPTGREVHVYAQGGGAGMDVILFTATNTGTFVVQCPLHPEIVGKLTVF